MACSTTESSGACSLYNNKKKNKNTYTHIHTYTHTHTHTHTPVEILKKYIKCKIYEPFVAYCLGYSMHHKVLHSNPQPHFAHMLYFMCLLLFEQQTDIYLQKNINP